MDLLKRYYIFFLCINIFLPKIDLGFGDFYLFEFINLFLFVALIFRGKILANGVVVTYIAFMLVCFLSFFFGMMYFNLFDAHSFGRLVKFTFFIFYILMPYVILNNLSERDLIKVLNYQWWFFVLAGAYVVFHMVTAPLTMIEYIWGYDNRYRLVGLTGYGINLSGKLERLEGTTSVSMGVYIAFVFLIFLARYHFYGGRKNLIKVCSLVVLEFLVYSRAGLLVMTTGVVYYFMLNVKPATILKVVASAISIFLIIAYFGLGKTLMTTGSLSKVFNLNVAADPRAVMLKAAINHVGDHPQTLLLGAGYGEKYTFLAVGYPHLEGLLPTILITAGIFALSALCLHFFFIWFYAKDEYLRGPNQFSAFLYGIRLFVPGWFLSALVAGNTFQTDFYFPVIYFVFITSYYLSKNLRWNKNIQPL
jgi:hypothetical protein